MIQTLDAAKAKPPGAGKSSFDLIEPARLLEQLPLKQGITFLDLGCGAGNYTLAVAEAIGKHGVVVALDLWPPGIEGLQEPRPPAAEISGLCWPISASSSPWAITVLTSA